MSLAGMLGLSYWLDFLDSLSSLWLMRLHCSLIFIVVYQRKVIHQTNIHCVLQRILIQVRTMVLLSLGLNNAIYRNHDNLFDPVFFNSYIERLFCNVPGYTS